MCLLDSAQENQLDAMDENDEDFEILEVEFTDEEKEVTEERDEWKLTLKPLNSLAYVLP